MEHTYNYDIDQYKFELFVGDDGYRWDDEGVLQPVKLSLNGHYIINNNWGIQHNLEWLMGESRSDSGMNDNGLLTFGEEETAYIIHPIITKDRLLIKDKQNNIMIMGDEYNNFIKWVKSCLSPKQERIKIKINQLLENKKRED